MSWAIVTTTAPAEEPVSLARAKAHLRVEHAADDDLIRQWITAARLLTEKFTGRRWVTQTVRYSAPGFPANGCPVRLPVSPVSAVTAVGYRDPDGVLVLAAADDWQTWPAHNPPLVAPAPARTWPATQAGRLAAVEIDATAGYGGAADVPADAVAAMLLCLGYWYENRGDDGRPGVPEHLGLPVGAVRLLAGLATGGYD